MTKSSCIQEGIRKMKYRLKRVWVLFCLCVSVVGYVSAEGSAPDISTMTVEELLQLQNAITMRMEQMGYAGCADIERGAKGDQVSAIQEKLTVLGYYDGKITGKFDNETQKAFKAFEKANGLVNDGIASRQDQVVLFSDVAAGRSDAMQVEEASADEADSKAENQPDFLVNVTSCWAPNTGLNGVTLYTPYLKVRVTNQRGKDATKISVNAVFYNESSKELWDDATYYLVNTNETPLKNGYNKTAYVKSTVGYKSKISEWQLPTITAEIYINGVLYDKVTVQNTYE